MLIGNLGKDPEIRVNPNGGRKRVSFSLATSRRYRDNNGEQKEQTDWHNIIGWGKVADVFEQLGIRKGTTLYVEGSITNRSWTDQTTGQKQYTTEINMDSFQLLTPRQQQSNGNGYGQGQQRQAYQQPQEAQGYGDEDVDLPF
jgi:single-strand DNA-binding protein